MVKKEKKNKEKHLTSFNRMVDTYSTHGRLCFVAIIIVAIVIGVVVAAVAFVIVINFLGFQRFHIRVRFPM